MGASILQEGQPVAYFSQKLSQTKQINTAPAPLQHHEFFH